ncbi:chemotaxis protein CheW [Rhodobacter ferrooxidans]|nr:chemotaxis protein CheW [Rhodobacter sp. SW2]
MQSPESHVPSEVEFVTFFTGGQSFSIDITQVREIRRWSAVTPLPHAPAEVLGVMNLRGSVIPIFDLAVRFGLNRTPDNARNVVVIAAHDNQTVGLLVESVSEILSVSRDRIQETPDLRSDNSRQSIIGVITVDEGMTRVIDLGAVITTGKRTVQ